jgi:class 3 adenylate cyclase
MAASGLLEESEGHAGQLTQFAHDMVLAASHVLTPLGDPIRLRVGIHSGRVMSGIVGTLRARYCLFGGATRCGVASGLGVSWTATSMVLLWLEAVGTK